MKRCCARCARRIKGSAKERRLELLRPESAEQAAQALGNGTRALAGGTDLVPLIRDGIVTAETLVDVTNVVPRGLQRSTPTSPSISTSVVVGGGTTLAELERDSDVPAALREACRQAASPQLRSMGTVAGNLLQATRCWYWRLQFPCYLHGGDRCHAKDGAHREHAIFGNDRCASGHPSDVAAALLALNATVRTTDRELPVADLYRLPTDDDRDVTALAGDELILELEVPAPTSSTYLKAMDRKKWAFPLVGVAAARFGDEIRLALAGVAPVPWVIESPGTLDDATPLPGTAYKVEIARALVRRALVGIDAGR
jgi:xanthine dehydrogenase YagS FAD-binding subunit